MNEDKFKEFESALKDELDHRRRQQRKGDLYDQGYINGLERAELILIKIKISAPAVAQVPKYSEAEIQFGRAEELKKSLLKYQAALQIVIPDQDERVRLLETALETERQANLLKIADQIKEAATPREDNKEKDKNE